MRTLVAILGAVLIFGCTDDDEGTGPGPESLPEEPVTEEPDQPPSNGNGSPGTPSSPGGPPAPGAPPQPGAPTPPAEATDGEGRFQWVQTDFRTRAQLIVATAADQAGNVYALKVTDSGTGTDVVISNAEVSKYTSDGQQVFARQYSMNTVWNAFLGHHLDVSDSGEIYFTSQIVCDPIVGCMPADFGGGPIQGQVLVKLNADGSFAWQRQVSEAGGGPSAMDVLGDGTVLLLTGETPPQLMKFDRDNQLLWSATQPGATAAAFDPSGNIALGVSVPPGGGLRKLSPEGQELWTTYFDSQQVDGFGRMRIHEVGTSALGTVVAVATYLGQHAWGPITLPVPDQGPPPYDHPTTEFNVLFAAEATGEPRFAVRLDDSYSLRLSVDPAGRAFVGAQAVKKYNLEGTLVWERTLPASVDGLSATPDHGVIVHGAFFDPVDFGSGPIDPGGRQGSFLLKLGP